MRNRPTTALIVIGAVLAGQSTKAFQNASVQHRFMVVSGERYQGAIIPARLVLDIQKAREESTWTPTPSDVASFESAVRGYFDQAAVRPGSVSPRLTTSNIAVDASEIRRLASALGEFRRQYFGTVRGSAKRIELSAFMESPRTAKWVDEVIMPPLDPACGFWFMAFDVNKGKIVDAHCGGSA